MNRNLLFTATVAAFILAGCAGIGVKPDSFGIEYSGKSEGGLRTVNLDGKELVGLNGFLFDFKKKANKLNSFELYTGDNELSVAFMDKKKQAPYSWQVWQTELPGSVKLNYLSGLTNKHVIPVGKDNFSDAIPVLLGIKLKFKSGERKIHAFKLGFEKDDDEWSFILAVGDKRMSDIYEYYVEWAWVPVEFILKEETSSGQADKIGAAMPMSFNKPLLRMIDFEFVDNSDFFLDMVGVQMNSENLLVWFSDDKASGAFNWSVGWVDLD